MDGTAFNKPTRSFLHKQVEAYRLAIGAGCLTVLLVLSGCNLKTNTLNQNGVRAFQSGQVPQAINEFQKAMMSNPGNADSYYNLAASYLALGRQQQNKQWFDQAEQLYRQAISVNDQHVDAHRGLAALLVETDRKDFAFDLLQTWQGRNPGATSPLIELARLHQEFGDDRRATDLLADALRINGNDARALWAMAHVREGQGELQLAMENYARILQVDPAQTDAASRIAALQTRMANGSANPGQNRYGSNPATARR